MPNWFKRSMVAVSEPSFTATATPLLPFEMTETAPIVVQSALSRTRCCSSPRRRREAQASASSATGTRVT